MAAHSYVPGLRLAANILNRYGTRYTRQLGVSLTSDQLTCLNAALTAVQALIVCLGSNPKQPNAS